MPISKQIQHFTKCLSASARRNYSKNALPSPGTLNVPSTKVVTRLPPLSESVPDLPTAIYATPGPESDNTKVTVLSNGLRVASSKRFGQFCTVGVIIDSGSRYETQYNSGISHFLEKLAFGATNLYKDKEQLLGVLERHAGICDSQSSRDTFVYAISADSKGLDTVTKILGDVVLRPQITGTEVEYARQTVKFELENLLNRPEQETLLMDLIHKAAYGDTTLGLPKICPIENLNTIDRDTLFTYLSQYYDPTRMVVTGVGVEHEKLLDCVQKYFVSATPNWTKRSDAKSVSNQSPAIYTGGFITENCQIPLYPGSDLPELSHVVIGFNGCSHQDKDFVPLCVLNMMMGGGGSFSAGGPGKGMYTRLYTNVLNRHHWMFSATAYNQSYADSGLFCIHAAAPPEKIGNTTEVIINEFRGMLTDPSKKELQRAKTQLTSMLLMNLESRPVVFEDIGRQVLATGSRKPPSFFIDAIESVTSDDIVRVGNRLLSSLPSVAARGKLGNLQGYNEIQKKVSNQRLLRSLFR